MGKIDLARCHKKCLFFIPQIANTYTNTPKVCCTAHANSSTGITCSGRWVKF